MQAIRRVARDFGLAPDWMNAVVGRQWRTGLPPGFEREVTWRNFGGLTIGLPGREALVCLKLFAAVDQGPASRHYHDLLALAPTAVELDRAARWTRGQDVSTEFTRMLEEVVARVRQPVR